MVDYPNTIYDQLQRIADTINGENLNEHSTYAELRRIADVVNPSGGEYSNDRYGQILRIADAVNPSNTEYAPSRAGQLQRIADALDSGGSSAFIYDSIKRIADNASGLIGDVTPPANFTSTYISQGIY